MHARRDGPFGLCWRAVRDMSLKNSIVTPMIIGHDWGHLRSQYSFIVFYRLLFLCFTLAVRIKKKTKHF